MEDKKNDNIKEEEIKSEVCRIYNIKSEKDWEILRWSFSNYSVGDDED